MTVDAKEATEIAAGARLVAARGQLWARLQGLWRRHRTFLILVVLALLIRLPLLPNRGFFDDIQALVNWGKFLDHHPLHFYSAGRGLHPTPDYPPLAMYLFGLLDGLYAILAHLIGAKVDLQVDFHPYLGAFFKLPALVAEMATMTVLYRLLDRTVSRRVALIAAAVYAFSPLILFGGTLWGQIDDIFVLGLVLALAYTLDDRPIAAGVAFGLALMIKPQPIVFAPLLLLYFWRWHGRPSTLRFVAATAATVAVVCLPYLIPPREMLAFAQDLSLWVKYVPYASVSAFNLWWLLGLRRVPYTQAVLGPLSPNLIGWALFALALAAVLHTVWRDRSPARLFFAAGVITVAFFDVGTLQHERYLYPAFTFFLLAAAYDRRHVLFFLWTSLMALLNIVLVVIAPPFSDSKIPYSLAIGRHTLTTHPQIYWTLALIDMLLLVVLLVASFLPARWQDRLAWRWGLPFLLARAGADRAPR